MDTADTVSSFIMSKLMGAYKSTTTSIPSSITSTTTSPLASPGLPANTSVTVYPTYARHDNYTYVTHINGVVTCSGALSRKNRFLLSMARRLTRDGEYSTDIENEMRDAIEHQETFDAQRPPSVSDTITSSSGATNPSTDTVKERMEGILAKIVPGTPLEIVVEPKPDYIADDLASVRISTDNFGMFQATLTTQYAPSHIKVTSIIDQTVQEEAAVEIVDPIGVSIITDIDDTIRETGVVGEKREMFRNIFARSYASCQIDGVSQWYRDIRDKFNCPIHYVSNSPWQIFNIVHGFLDYQKMPVTSVHLRQYSGNMVASFTQPSAERKRPSLVALLQEFPDRKFVLIGDTGEQDIEAYLSLIPNFAPQILAVYMRVVPMSLSNSGNDAVVLEEIRQVLSKRDASKSKDVMQFLRNPTGVDSDDGMDIPEPQERSNIRRRSSFGIEAAKNTFNSAVRMSGVKKLAPIVPRKPDALRGSRIDPVAADSEPVLKSRKLPPPPTEIEEPTIIPPMPVAAEAVDKRRSLWRLRAQRIVDEVPEHIEVKFWVDSNEVRDESMGLIAKELQMHN